MAIPDYIPTETRPQQKRWIDLLGNDPSWAMVQGRDIVRHDPVAEDRYKIMWTFDTPGQAKVAYDQWKHEIWLHEMT